MAALTVDQVFDALSLRINGPKAWDEHFVSDWRFTDEDRVHRVELRNGVLVHYDRPADISEPDVTFTLTRPILIKVLLDGTDPAQLVASGEITVDGDVTGFARLVAVLDQPDPNFAIVTP
ncbi:Beta-lactamase-like [Mycobacteroides abscessus subsp. massiliense]|nr:Beta-lactamase-like [Mycobacteroides abscessus subsp. massiliense]